MIKQLKIALSVTRKCRLAALAFAAAAAIMPALPAEAHPDYWVTVKYQLVFDESAVTEVRLTWEFDVFYSSQAFNRYDLDRDGAFSGEEAARLKAAIFDPLQDDGYFVKVVQGNAIKTMRLGTFAPQVAEDRLVLGFSLLPNGPLDYRAATLSVATHDKTAYDFTLAESGFLTVDGAFDAACRFRIEEGQGVLDGVPQTLALLCPE